MIARRTTRWNSTLIAGCMLLGTIVSVVGVPVPVTSAAQAAGEVPVPVFAYYYIWFNPTSWERAKTDYPVLGKYSSDETRVMRTHIKWAKEAGIDGFIVSWKSTSVLNRRLERLLQVAGDENFKLAIIYQGLDFDRDPLNAQQVAADLDHFIDRYGSASAFLWSPKPLVIWSGTWKFSLNEIEQVTGPRRDRLRILASARSLRDFERVTSAVDGNAYYWSSVNPKKHPRYKEKLRAMGEAVHQRGGSWIAPAAPGFDARGVGGTSIVPRLGGDTLRSEITTAVGSSPDMLGLISWNEFSENSHVEPSKKYGNESLDVLADLLGARAPVVNDFDSSSPTGSNKTGIFVIGGFVLIFALLSFVTLRSRLRNHSDGAARKTSGAARGSGKGSM